MKEAPEQRLVEADWLKERMDELCTLRNILKYVVASEEGIGRIKQVCKMTLDGIDVTNVLRGGRRGELNAREKETLRLLQWAKDRNQGPSADGWVRPMDIGGTGGSHHCYTLNKLVGRGLVVVKRRVCSIIGALGSAKAGRLYRIVDGVVDRQEEEG